ncbi:major facilitator superfamily transporter [Nemania sp. FL0031]|nr:major facilitator superfamily transporter [Nemania sp. FL0031]
MTTVPVCQTPVSPVPYSLFTRNERRIIVGLIAFAGWFSTLSSFIYYPAIPAIATSLHSSIDFINLTVTSYLVVSAIAPAFVGDASDTFGRRPLYAVTLTLYVAANISIALQHSAVALLVLRMLQSIGISGAFSVAYGVIADISVPSERGAFVSAVSFGITTAPSLGPVVGGVLAFGPGWRWIFWFLTIAAGSCLIAICLALPETNHVLVGNGGIKPPRALCLPLSTKGFMQPWAREDGAACPIPSRTARKIPNPIQSLRILSREDVAVSIMPGSLLYTVYCCIHTSLSSTFIPLYDLNELQVSLLYLPFGIGAVLSTVVSSRWIDHDYRVVAKAHGLPINQVSGDDLLQFPIEKARLRSAFVPTISAFASTLSYGWLVSIHTHIAGPSVLLFVIGFSIQTCFNINNTLLVDINQDRPATAQASSNIVRCILSAILVAVLQKLIDALGFGLAFTILSFFCLAAGIFYLIELKYGMKWRLARHRITAD